MNGAALMVQGVASSVGKSVLTTALCRIYARRGVRVAPFKAQNMSNNAAVTPEGGEIGRAQWLQAVAAGVTPSVRLNPILLKPEFGGKSQVIVLGAPRGSQTGRSYFTERESLWPVVRSSLDELRAGHDLVIIEGAGSPAEVNLRQWDIVNMRVAAHAGAPVLLVADIDRGGALAALVGTLELLQPSERALVRGLVINRFRGDRSLLEPALEFLHERTSVPVLGVIPYVDRVQLPSEDGASLDETMERSTPAQVAAIRLPHVSNFDDLDPLAAAGLTVRWTTSVRDVEVADLVVLPGSKSSRSDMEFLWSSGLGAAIRAAARRGAIILGLCGGYQMLGSELIDPEGIEGAPGTTPGLGLLDVRTEFQRDKRTRAARGTVAATVGPLGRATGAEVRGYEIHDGVTGSHGPALLALEDPSTTDGAYSEDGRIIGTYLHGLLHNRAVLDAICDELRHEHAGIDPSCALEQALERLADVAEAHFDMRAIDDLVGLAQR